LFDKNPTNISREKLKELIKLNKNCHFKETNYKSNLNKIFLNKHVFILPSHREGLPKTALEAMNHDNALLLSDIPGHKLLIAKKYVNGLFFKKKNEKDLSKKIVWMINNKKEVIKFINNSKKNLSKFSTQNINKKFYETITKI
jgi:glycosyltransferase involved in cell wall biosynthesis